MKIMFTCFVLYVFFSLPMLIVWEPTVVSSHLVPQLQDAWQLLAVDAERAHGALMVGFAMRWLDRGKPIRKSLEVPMAKTCNRRTLDRPHMSRFPQNARKKGFLSQTDIYPVQSWSLEMP